MSISECGIGNQKLLHCEPTSQLDVYYLVILFVIIFICKFLSTYEPNVPIAKRKLSPLGVDVFEIKDDKDLPFTESEFEVIINRHESYAPDEVRRILQPSGFFITQQVGEKNDIDINHLLDCKLPTEDDIQWLTRVYLMT